MESQADWLPLYLKLCEFTVISRYQHSLLSRCHTFPIFSNLFSYSSLADGLPVNPEKNLVIERPLWFLPLLLSLLLPSCDNKKISISLGLLQIELIPEFFRFPCYSSSFQPLHLSFIAFQPNHDICSSCHKSRAFI